MNHDAGPDLDAVVRYHEASKHHLNRYAPGPRGLDWANQPDPFRTFAGAPRLQLQPAADSLATPYGQVRRGERPPPRTFCAESVGLLLELTLGLSAWKACGPSRWALRCNPSSGNLHPTEGYLVCPRLPGIDAGVWHYVSRDHLLERRAAYTEAAAAKAFPAGGVLVGLSSIHWREAWKYGMRAWRYCQHDCGHAMAALAYAAAALGWSARVVDGLSDADLAALLGLDRPGDFQGAEPEAPDVLLWVGDGAAVPDPARLEVLTRDAEFAGRASRLSAQHVAWPDMEQVTQAARKAERSAGSRRVPEALPPLAPLPRDMAASVLYRRRRSAVDFDGVTSIRAQAWFAMLDALLPRADIPPADALPWRARVHLALLVHRVQGVEPGLYFLAREREAVPALKAAMNPDWSWAAVPRCPAHVPLYLLARADCRDAARAICCHQDIAADSAFALGFVAQFRQSLAQGPWVYRELFWETGLLGQALYLEAEAAGVRATGIGCFFDDAMHELLGLRDLSFQSLYHFTVGGAVEDSRLQTLPPYAHLAR